MKLDERLFKYYGNIIEGIKDISDTYFPIYRGDTVYDIKRLLVSKPGEYRFIYCRDSDLWFIVKAGDYTHIELAYEVAKQGYTDYSRVEDDICYPSTSKVLCFAYLPSTYSNNE